MSRYKKGDRVVVLDFKAIGTVFNVRLDDRNDEIYTILLDAPNVTPDGFYYARNVELRAAE